MFINYVALSTAILLEAPTLPYLPYPPFGFDHYPIPREKKRQKKVIGLKLEKKSKWRRRLTQKLRRLRGREKSETRA